ncbi:hypothetical protein KC644_00280 [Candidatus Berkelbacteria bacterium]|nr:hypothetical protein [Candidatus Berkelbacteria bacterium]
MKKYEHIKIEITKIEQLALDIKEFTASRVDGQDYRFSPGQHLLFWLPTKYSSFSLASNPINTKEFAFAVRKIGRSTGFLHDEVNVGDELEITAPMGKGFDQEKIKGKDIWFIAGGIGLMGLSAQILTIEANPDLYPGQHKLFYGLRDRRELLWPDKIERWKDFMDIDITGDGRHLVGDLLHEDLEVHDEIAVFICGPAAFFKPIFQLLIKLGIKPQNIQTNIWE